MSLDELPRALPTEQANSKAGAFAPARSFCKGAAEHPEELADRCCLSALAGLSKYLPPHGTALHYSQLFGCVNLPAINTPVGGISLHV